MKRTTKSPTAKMNRYFYDNGINAHVVADHEFCRVNFEDLNDAHMLVDVFKKAGFEVGECHNGTPGLHGRYTFLAKA